MQKSKPGQGGVAGDLGVGVELTAAHALDVLGVGAVVDVASEPGSAGHVGEEVVVSVDADLLVLHVAGDDAVDDGRSLSAGDGTLGLEGTVLIALEEIDETLGYKTFKLEQIEGIVMANEYADLNSNYVLGKGKTNLQVAGEESLRNLAITR